MHRCPGSRRSPVVAPCDVHGERSWSGRSTSRQRARVPSGPASTLSSWVQWRGKRCTGGRCDRVSMRPGVLQAVRHETLSAKPGSTDDLGRVSVPRPGDAVPWWEIGTCEGCFAGGRDGRRGRLDRRPGILRHGGMARLFSIASAPSTDLAAQAPQVVGDGAGGCVPVDVDGTIAATYRAWLNTAMDRSTNPG